MQCRARRLIQALDWMWQNSLPSAGPLVRSSFIPRTLNAPTRCITSCVSPIGLLNALGQLDRTGLKRSGSGRLASFSRTTKIPGRQDCSRTTRNECIEQDALATGFAREYARDPRRGYGGTAHGILRAIGEGTSWQTAAGRVFDGQGSCGNGGAMRSAPIGAYFA